MSSEIFPLKNPCNKYQPNQKKSTRVACLSYSTITKNKYTKQVKCFDEDIEGFLGIDKPSRKDQKPLSIIYKYNQKEIVEDKINALKTLFEDLFK
jgi:hypothetical protein